MLIVALPDGTASRYCYRHVSPWSHRLLEFDVKVRSQRGLHVRPAAQVVAITSEFDSRVRLIYEDRSVDGKSILGLLVLAAPHGARLRVQLDGPDEETAGSQLRALFDSFPEKTTANLAAE